MTQPDAPETRAQQRAREAAERAEWDRLTARLGILWPGYDCFCGTLDDLRRTVSDLERRAAHGRAPRTGAGVRGRLAAHRAAGQVVAQDRERAAQIARWHSDDSTDRAGSTDRDDGDGADLS